MSGRGDDAFWRTEEDYERFRDGVQCATKPAPTGEGVKFDTGKLRMDLLPPDALEAMARILTSGAEKYGERGWERGMAWSRPYAALLRHLLAWWGGQDTDPESGHPHLWHVMTNAVFLVSYEQRKVGEDDRP